MIGVTKYCFHDAFIAYNLWYCKHQPTLHIVKCTMNCVIFLPRVGLVGGSSQCFANFWFCRSTPLSFWRYKSYLEWNISVYLGVQLHKAFCIHNLSFSPTCNSFLFVLLVNGWGLGQITFSVITRVEIQEELVLRFNRIAKELVMWTCSVSSLHISPLPDTCGAWRGVCWLVKIGLYLAYRTNS